AVFWRFLLRLAALPRDPALLRESSHPHYSGGDTHESQLSRRIGDAGLGLSHRHRGRNCQRDGRRDGSRGVGSADRARPLQRRHDAVHCHDERRALARVQVFYPTLALADPTSVYTIVTPAGYRILSPLGAVVNAVAEPGGFPVIAYDHGGAAAGGDIQRVTQLPLHERMATHGFVVFVALHSADYVARARDLSLLIDHALAATQPPATSCTAAWIRTGLASRGSQPAEARPSTPPWASRPGGCPPTAGSRQWSSTNPE